MSVLMTLKVVTQEHESDLNATDELEFAYKTW